MGNKIGSLFWEITAETDKFQAGLDQSKKQTVDLKSSLNDTVKELTGFSIQSLTVAGGLTAIAAGAKKAVDEYINYGAQVRQLTALTGAGSEQTSRLMQAFDDMGISADKFSAIAQGAARTGFVMTIDNVAKLADQYNSLSSQEDKNALLTKNLGRGALDAAVAFQQGGQAIRDFAAAQADGMIIKDADARSLERLRRNTDELNDSWTAVSNSFAKVVVPELNNVLTVMQHHGEKLQWWQRLLEGIPVVAAAVTAVELQQARAIQNTTDAALEYGDSLAESAKNSDRALLQKKTEITALQDEKSGWAALPPTMQGYITAADEAAKSNIPLIDSTNALSLSMSAYNQQLLYKIASEGLDVKGQTALALSMGLIDEKSRYAIVKTQEWRDELNKGMMTVEQYNRNVAGLANSLDRIQSKQVMIDIWINTYGGSQYYSGPGSEEDQNPLHTKGTGRAVGGPATANYPYMIGEKGPELFVPKQSGTIIPNNSIGGITINYYGGASTNDVRKLAQQVAKEIQRARNN